MQCYDTFRACLFIIYALSGPRRSVRSWKNSSRLCLRRSSLYQRQTSWQTDVMPLTVNQSLVIVDDHNGYCICQKHDLPFRMQALVRRPA